MKQHAQKILQLIHLRPEKQCFVDSTYWFAKLIKLNRNQNSVIESGIAFVISKISHI